MKPGQIERRDKTIREMFDKGFPLSFIGLRFNISRERVRQICESKKDKK